MRIFLAIATGQNQANLAPILTFGQPGYHVVWLESSYIKHKNLAAGSTRLLLRRGFHCESIETPEETWWRVPARSASVCSNYINMLIQNAKGAKQAEKQ